MRKNVSLYLSICVMLGLIAGLWFMGKDQQLKKLPYIVFSEEIGEDKFEKRTYPIFRLYKQRLGQKPQELMTVGNARKKEYPKDFQYSPDRKYLVINLESKLLLVNLENNSIKTVFPKRSFTNGFVFSQDSSQLFIWDQFYVTRKGLNEDNAGFAHVYTVSEEEDSIVYSSVKVLEYDFTPLVWRKDNKVLLKRNSLTSQALYYFDLDTNNFDLVKDNFEMERVSQSGLLVAELESVIGSECNVVSGVDTELFTLMEPISGKTLYQTGISGLVAKTIIISPDDSQVLYYTFDANNPNIDCNDIQYTYHLQDFATGAISGVVDPMEIISKWSGSPFEAEVRYDELKNEYILMADGKEVYRASGKIIIIGQVNRFGFKD